MNARRRSRIERKREAERFGRLAELLAVTALRLRGYRILRRRFRAPLLCRAMNCYALRDRI